MFKMYVYAYIHNIYIANEHEVPCVFTLRKIDTYRLCVHVRCLTNSSLENGASDSLGDFFIVFFSSKSFYVR